MNRLGAAHPYTKLFRIVCTCRPLLLLVLFENFPLSSLRKVVETGEMEHSEYLVWQRAENCWFGYSFQSGVNGNKKFYFAINCLILEN